MRNVQVRAELGITRAIEAMTGHAVLLVDGETGLHLSIGIRRREQGREALFDSGQLTNPGDLKGPLLGADLAGRRIGPDQVERSCAGFALCQRRPGMLGIFDGQPGFCSFPDQQNRGWQFCGKTVERHGLEMVAGLDTLQQRTDRHGAVVHGALVADVIDDLDIARLRVHEQFAAAPGASAIVELHLELGRLGHAAQDDQSQQQGSSHSRCSSSGRSSS